MAFHDNLLGSGRRLSDEISYTPSAGTAARKLQLFESDTALGTGGVIPWVLRDTLFWSASDYPRIINAAAATKSYDWDLAAPTKTASGLSGIKKTAWEEIRGTTYDNTEMVGVMLATLTYDNNTVRIISAAPNVLYSEKTGYSNHLKTAKGNVAGQNHSEMLFAAQLTALVKELKDNDEIPTGAFTPRKGLSQGALGIDVDLMIEKNVMCVGCSAVWKAFTTAHTGAIYRNF
jgi:hypothetical protein